jgi:hypothetical protein
MLLIHLRERLSAMSANLATEQKEFYVLRRAGWQCFYPCFIQQCLAKPPRQRKRSFLAPLSPSKPLWPPRLFGPLLYRGYYPARLNSSSRFEAVMPPPLRLRVASPIRLLTT